MDLEMTGLNPETDVIVEIATLVTDDELNIIAEGPNLVIFQPEEAMASMGDFVTQMHTTSGLLELIKTSTVSHDDAMQQTLDFIKLHSPESGKIPGGYGNYLPPWKTWCAGWNLVPRRPIHPAGRRVREGGRHFQGVRFPGDIHDSWRFSSLRLPWHKGC